jgi:methylated-DNA-[protein]-cysteine S-methyltransferase
MSYLVNYMSPYGHFIINADEKGVTSLELSSAQYVDRPCPLLLETKKQLDAYFKKELQVFDLALNFEASNASPFMVKIWNELICIPYGKTISYLDLARRVATDKHTRAVGMANGKNPIPIIVPCHRVIGSNGSLVGFALGLEMKKHLLDHESPASTGKQMSLF